MKTKIKSEQVQPAGAPGAETWHAANMGNDHQGLIISDKDGRNVAVAYDKADAPLLAAAPELFAALESLMETEDELRCDCVVMRQARAAIAKARGQ